MLLGRSHRLQIRYPVHFTAPDRSRTYIGTTLDLSATGFSIEVKTDEPLPPIILAGVLPTQVAGDAILCKARIVWQGGLAHGIGRASYKIISIAQRSQERLEQLLQRSLAELLAGIRELPTLQGCSDPDLEVLLSLARVREAAAGKSLYATVEDRSRGVYLILEGAVTIEGDEPAGRLYGRGSVIGSWSEPDAEPGDRSAVAQTDTRALHLPLALVAELQNRAPHLAATVAEALGRPAEPPHRAAAGKRAPRMRLDIPRELQEIPTLPSVFNAVMDCVENPESTPRDLAQVLRQDQSLTAKLLKAVNSALYGFTRRIVSVNEAVVLLGMQETANLAITAMLLNTLADDSRPGQRPEPFWEHALGAALFAQAIGQRLKRREGAGALGAAIAIEEARRVQGPAEPAAAETDPAAVAPRPAAAAPDRVQRHAPTRDRAVRCDRLFTYAILHDIGLVVLFLKFPDHFTMVQEAVRESGDFHRAELDILEIDHCQLGYRVARAWRLPEPIPTIIAEHHLPQIWAADMQDRDRLLALLREDPTVAIVSLADLLARRCGIGLELDREAPEIPSVLHEVLGLDDRDVAELLAQGDGFREKAERFFRGSSEEAAA